MSFFFGNIPPAAVHPRRFHRRRRRRRLRGAVPKLSAKYIIIFKTNKKSLNQQTLEQPVMHEIAKFH